MSTMLKKNYKGTLSVGKQADFVALDQNPLTAPSDEICDITVEQTYKAGECIYSR